MNSFGCPKAVIRSAGIRQDIIEGPPSSIEAVQFFSLVDAISIALNDEFLGFTSKPCKIGTFGMMCRSVIHSEHLLQALRRSCRFYNICNDSIAFSLLSDSSNLEFKLSAKTEYIVGREPFIYESIFAIWHRLSCWLVGRPVELIEIRLPFTQPPYFKKYFDIFNCPIRFEKDSATLVIKGSDGLSPIVRSEMDLKVLLANEPFAHLFDDIETLGIYNDVRHILESLDDHEQTLEHVACYLNLTPQTLHRRLKGEGIKFTDIKDQLRRDRAIAFLTNKNQSIHQIAEFMGFSEPSTFHRAFKKWTGMTPGEFRRNLH